MILDPDILQRPAFHLFSVPVTWLELFGDVTGLACVWLVARQNIWNWPIGIVNNLLFMILFWRSRLYADASLQVVFALLAVYGWYTWLHPPASGGVLAVRRTSLFEWLAIAAFCVIGQALAFWYLSQRTDSPVPFWDAAILVLSLAATYGQARKRLESWWLWIAVDVISVPLYIGRQLLPTALLYFLFLCLCVKGFLAWRAALRRAEQPAS